MYEPTQVTRAGNPVTHGTRTAYRKHGCRCGECRSWEAARKRRQLLRGGDAAKEAALRKKQEYRDRNRDSYLASKKEYSARNKDAVKEWNVKSIERRNRQNEISVELATIPPGTGFTEAEDATLLSRPANLDLALEMGRTLRSISNRKTLLRKRLREMGEIE